MAKSALSLEPIQTRKSHDCTTRPELLRSEFFSYFLPGRPWLLGSRGRIHVLASYVSSFEALVSECGGLPKMVGLTGRFSGHNQPRTSVRENV